MKQKFFIFACFAVIFVTVFGSSVHAASLEDFPAFPSSGVTVIYKDTAGNFSAFVTVGSAFEVSPSDINYYGYDNSLSIENKSNATSVLCYYYILTDGAWVKNTTVQVGKGESKLLNSAVVSFVYSDIDILNTDGTVLFPAVPMTPTLEQAVQESLGIYRRRQCRQ